jgi:hypothetical protein
MHFNDDDLSERPDAAELLITIIFAECGENEYEPQGKP